MLSAALEQELRWLAGRAGADADANITELPSYDAVRTFRMGSNILRVDESPNGQSLLAEGLALRVLGSVSIPPMVPSLTATGRDVWLGHTRPWLSYPYLVGTTLTQDNAATCADEIGRLLGVLHTTSVFDLRERFPNVRPMTLMETFKETQEHLRVWLEQRELDGLGPDLLTLAISDLQGGLRPYVLEADPHFWVARRRVLCHGRLEPSRIVRDEHGNLRFVGLEHAYLGDPYEDLAHFSLSARLPRAAEEQMLAAYRATLDEKGREDQRLLPRYSARRTLGLLQLPARRLHRIVQLKNIPHPDRHVLKACLRHEMRSVQNELMQALNELRSFLGNQRLVTLREVESMGRLVAYEDLFLHEQRFWLAITGQPYAGKTELSTQLARRLSHQYLNTDALARALALRLSRMGYPGKSERVPTALAALLGGELKMTTEVASPFYRVYLSDEEITESLRVPNIRASGAKLLDDEHVREQMRGILERTFPSGGLVLEGTYSDSMLPVGHHHFFVCRDTEMRRAHLRGHRHPLEDDEDAEALLMHLDEATAPPPPGAIAIDLMRRPAASASLDVLWHLIEPSQRPAKPMTDLSGRPLLFQK